jgi:hypothetical protein
MKQSKSSNKQPVLLIKSNVRHILISAMLSIDLFAVLRGTNYRRAFLNSSPHRTLLQTTTSLTPERCNDTPVLTQITLSCRLPPLHADSFHKPSLCLPHGLHAVTPSALLRALLDLVATLQATSPSLWMMLSSQKSSSAICNSWRNRSGGVSIEACQASQGGASCACRQFDW